MSREALVKRNRFLLIGIAASMLLAAGLATTVFALGRTQGEDSGSSTSRASKGNALEERLDEILETQESMLLQLDEALKELEIVKIRASMRRCP